jgi:hypothetical protein
MRYEILTIFAAMMACGEAGYTNDAGREVADAGAVIGEDARVVLDAGNGANDAGPMPIGAVPCEIDATMTYYTPDGVPSVAYRTWVAFLGNEYPDGPLLACSDTPYQWLGCGNRDGCMQEGESLNVSCTTALISRTGTGIYVVFCGTEVAVDADQDGALDPFSGNVPDYVTDNL